MSKRISLFSLQTFSSTGGIQKMTRTLVYTLWQLSKQKNYDFRFWSLYDKDQDLIPRYISSSNFKGFNYNRFKFAISTAKEIWKNDIVVLTHINMSIIGLIAKIVKPRCQIMLIAHGIEIWGKLSALKLKLLQHANYVICVSGHTRKLVIQNHHIQPEKCLILNNSLDPFFTLPDKFIKPDLLQKRYGITNKNQVIFTLTRLASTEQYKGHEHVIKVIGRIKNQFPDIKYILAGHYDAKEEKRIKTLINDNLVCDQVILTGFISEDEIVDHFLLADLFVLPSKKEGFGIVFIEAQSCGLPVICGNADGSLDAIKNSSLCTAVNPDDLNELQNSICKYLENPLTNQKKQQIQQNCFNHYNQKAYQKNLSNLFCNDARS